MQNNVDLARRVGALHIPEVDLIDVGDLRAHPPGDVCVISTGSQGEPMSALALMANGENRRLQIGPDDTVILSSHPIPGNEMNVSRVIDGLVRRGARVVHSGIRDVHATGHAQQEELKTLLSIAQPDWFVPVHGEYRHLDAHARLAVEMGVPEPHVLLCEDGDRVTLGDDGLRRETAIPAGYLYVDGTLGDISHGVLRDRRHLADEGVLVAVVTIDIAGRRILTGPELITRGWTEQPPADDLIKGCADAIRAAIAERLADPAVPDIDTIHHTIRRTAGRYVKANTRRRPMILPVVIET
jgi:ribonuclease J